MVGGITSTQQPTILDRFNNATGLNRVQGAQYRITPQNYRQVLGQNADVLLTPQQMKDMFEKGYLDVQRQFTQQESNEGLFTITAKAMAALIGPSRSIGAISIDPKFLDMIKDDNAQIGFGYTRLKQETLTALPYPKEPVRPELQPSQPQQPPLQQVHIDVQRPTQRTEEHREQLIRFRRQQEQRIQTQGRQTYVLTGTENWSQEEVNHMSHGNSVLSTGFRDLIGMDRLSRPDRQRLINYAILSSYLDSNPYGSTQASNGTRNGLEMANTVASYDNDFIGRELASRRGKGYYFEYNKDYGFMTLGTFTHYRIAGNPDLEADFIKFKTRDLMRTNPGLTEEQARAQAEEFLAKNKDSLTAADLFTLVTQNTTLGEAAGGVADIQNLEDRYSSLLRAELLRNSPLLRQIESKFKIDLSQFTLDDFYKLKSKLSGMTQEQIKQIEDHIKQVEEQVRKIDLSQVTLADFYALQYNASAQAGKYPPNAITVDRNTGHVQILGRRNPNGTILPNSQQDAVRDVMNLRVVAETNFGRRTGESLVFGPERINNFAAANNMNARLDESDAANVVNISVQELDRLLETVGLNKKDGKLTRDGEEVNLVPEGLRKELIAIFDQNPTLITNNRDFYNGLTATPAVVTVADAQRFVQTAKQAGVNLPQGMSRITNPMRIETITTEEWQQILPHVQDSDPKSKQQAKDGQFVIVEPGKEQVVQGSSPVEAELTGTEMLELAKGKASEDTIKEVMAVLGISEADIRHQLQVSEGQPIDPTKKQEYLFQRVMTDVFGMSAEQASTALVTTRSTNSFSFPETPSPVQGIEVTERVTSVPDHEKKDPDLPSVQASLAANLRTLGELAANPVVILNDTEKEDLKQLKEQIRSDVATLKASGVTEIMVGNQKLKLSDIEARLDADFAKVDENVRKGDEAVRAQMLQQGLNPGDVSDRQTFMQNMETITSTNARFQGMPPIPRVPRADQPIDGFCEAVQQSVKDFGQFVRRAMYDSTDAVTGEASTAGNITEAELQRMRDWVETSIQQMADSLKMDQNTLLGNGLQDKLKEAGYSEAQIAEIMRTVDMLKDAKANVNMVREGAAFQKVQENISQLSQRLKEFETVGVARKAFVGEMQDLATKNPERFRDIIRGAFQLDPKNLASEKVVNDLLDMAQQGRIPFPANIQFVDPQVLGGANAAYLASGEGGEPAILLSRNLLDQPAALRDALAEEMFHHMERQTMDFRAEEALKNLWNKLPEDLRSRIPNPPPARLEALPEDIKNEVVQWAEKNEPQLLSDYRAARAGTFDVQGDEGRAGLRALQAVRKGQDVLEAANEGRDETAQGVNLRNPGVRGDDHGTVMINGQRYAAQFQSSTVNQTAQPPSKEEIAAETLNTQLAAIERHSGREPSGLKFKAEDIKLDANNNITHIRYQGREMSLLEFANNLRNLHGGSPAFVETVNQAVRASLRAAQPSFADSGLDIRPNNIYDTGQRYTNIQADPNPWGRTPPPQVDASGGTSSHSFEQDDDFWGKARQMGAQAGTALLNFLSSGTPGAICEQIAQGIRNAWQSFYASVTKHSTIAHRSQAEDVVQSGFDVGRDPGYEAGRTNLINRESKTAWGQYWQNYQNSMPLQESSTHGLQARQREISTNSV